MTYRSLMDSQQPTIKQKCHFIPCEQPILLYIIFADNFVNIAEIYQLIVPSLSVSLNHTTRFSSKQQSIRSFCRSIRHPAKSNLSYMVVIICYCNNFTQCPTISFPELPTADICFFYFDRNRKTITSWSHYCAFALAPNPITRNHKERCLLAPSPQ